MAIPVTTAEQYTIKQGARVVVRLSNGRVYVVIEDTANDQITVWKANATTPASFSEPDTGNGPSGTVWGSCSACVDSNDVIHIAYCTDEGKSSQLRYVQFISDAFANDEQVIDDLESDPLAITNLQTAIAIDSNDKPHIAFCHLAKTGGNENYEISYINDIDNNWNAGTYYEVEGSGNGKDCRYPDISIDKDNKPVIAYHNGTDNACGTAIGNQNDAESFTLQDVGEGNAIAVGGPSIAVDSSGNHHVAWNEQNGCDIRKHNYGAGWGSWQAKEDVGSLGTEFPSLAIDGTDRYIFFVDAIDDDVKYFYYTDSWQETSLDEGTYNTAKAKWAYAVDYDSGGTDRGGGSGRVEIDYVFADSTNDILFNSLALVAEEGPANLKSVDGVAKANITSVGSVALGSIKSIAGIE